MQTWKMKITKSVITGFVQNFQLKWYTESRLKTQKCVWGIQSWEQSGFELEFIALDPNMDFKNRFQKDLDIECI